MAGKPIRAALMRYLEQRPGMRVYLSDIVAELGETRQRVQAGMLNLRQYGGDDFPVETVTAGQAWVYRPNGQAPANSKPIFELVGEVKDGSLILQREDGKLYRAVEL